MKYTLSKHLHHRGVSNEYCGIYNPLKNHSIIFLDANTYRELLSFKEPKELDETKGIERGLIRKLIEDKFLLPSDYDQNKSIKDFGKKIPKDPRFVLMYLLLTDNCNLRCEYCFEVGNENHLKKREDMSRETASNAIDLFAKVADKKTEEGHKVIFYGGEPFMNKDTFRFSVQKLREYEKNKKLKNLTMIVNTNGSMVDESLAEFCAKYKVNPAISIDGTKEIHDAVRRGNFSSFDGAIRGYKLFKEHGLNPGISCTISSKNVENLKDMAEFLVSELEPNGIGFNFLLDLKCGRNPLSVPIEKSTKKLIEVFEFLREKGIYEERLMRRVGKLIDNSIHLKDCAGYGHQFVVGPDGSFGPCQVFLNAKEYIAGNVNNNPPDPREHKMFLEWNKRTAFNMEGCEECDSITLCGGGCAYNSYVTKGSIWEKDERMCKHCNILIDWIIDDIWKRKNASSDI